MAVDEPVRYRLRRRLEWLVGPEEAEAVMTSMPPFAWTDLATKRDLEGLRDALRAELYLVRADLVDRIGGLDARLSAVETRIDGLDARLSAVETRIDGLDARLGAVETRIDGLDARLSAVEAKVDRVESKVDRLDARLGALEARLGALEQKMGSYAAKLVLANIASSAAVAGTVIAAVGL